MSKKQPSKPTAYVTPMIRAESEIITPNTSPPWLQFIQDRYLCTLCQKKFSNQKIPDMHLEIVHYPMGTIEIIPYEDTLSDNEDPTTK